MMKRILVVLLTLVLCMTLAVFEPAGTTRNVVIDYGSSVLFSEKEIASAVRVVLVEFRKYKGCDLRRLYYDERKYLFEIDGYMTAGRGSVNGVEKENVIILFSDFYVPPFPGGSGSRSGGVRHHWSWILIRDSANGNWIINDHGY